VERIDRAGGQVCLWGWAGFGSVCRRGVDQSGMSGRGGTGRHGSACRRWCGSGGYVGDGKTPVRRVGVTRLGQMWTVGSGWAGA
jgi:hypothetical protein